MTRNADSHEPVAPTTTQQLTPEDVGRWLVITQGSEHVFDLDRLTYQRLPGHGRGAFSYDSAVLPLGRVDRWPAVGGTFLIWFDDPSRPDEVEHWRQSSTIRSIERLEGKPSEDGQP